MSTVKTFQEWSWRRLSHRCSYAFQRLKLLIRRLTKRIHFFPFRLGDGLYQFCGLSLSQRIARFIAVSTGQNYLTCRASSFIDDNLFEFIDGVFTNGSTQKFFQWRFSLGGSHHRLCCTVAIFPKIFAHTTPTSYYAAGCNLICHLLHWQWHRPWHTWPIGSLWHPQYG